MHKNNYRIMAFKASPIDLAKTVTDLRRLEKEYRQLALRYEKPLRRPENAKNA